MMETPISDSVVWHTLFRAQHVFMQLQLGTRSKTLDGSIAYAKLVVLQRVNSLQLYLSISYANTFWSIWQNVFRKFLLLPNMSLHSIGTIHF